MSNTQLKIPTLGGRQYWSDHFVHAGWRIQENTWTGHFRLLDPEDFRVTYGSWENCCDHFDTYAGLHNITWPNEHLVVLVHGLCRTKGAFYKMRKMLTENGLSVQAINYPSTRLPTDKFASQLNELIARLRGIRKVSFVTHSLGGIVVRKALAEKHAWMDWLEVGDVIQIAPPNKGASIAASFKALKPFQWGAGPAGLELVKGFDIKAPATPTKFHVIAGGTGDTRGFNPFLGRDNDGLVSVEETDLYMTHSKYQFQAPHTLLINKPETLTLVKNTLK